MEQNKKKVTSREQFKNLSWKIKIFVAVLILVGVIYFLNLLGIVAIGHYLTSLGY